MAQRIPSTAGLPVGSDHYRALVENSREMMMLASGDGEVLYATPETLRTLGYREEELIGRNAVGLVHPEDLGQAREKGASLLAKPGGAEHALCRLRCRDGSYRRFEFRVRNFIGDPKIEALVVHFRDITEQHRSEAERQVIFEIIQALNHTHNLDELLGRIHQALKKVVYAENCFVALHERNTGMFHFPFLVDQYDTAPPPQKVGKSCTAYVFRTGRAMLIPQKVFDELAALGEVELVGSPSPSWLGVPLKTPNETIGVLVVQHYEDEDAYDGRDLEFLESVGGHIALAIERKRSEDTLRSNEALFRLLFAHNPLPTWVFDKQTLEFLQVNHAAIQQYGYSESEFLSMGVTDLRPPGDDEEFLEQFGAGQPEGIPRGIPRKHRHKDGRLIEVEVRALDLEYHGRPAVLAVAQDTTERRMLEAQFRQAQKMEAIGRLAGGVAHDFNNLLMVIKGHIELLLERLPGSESAVRKIEQIDRAADRATSLTRQLLAFSRMQVLQPKVINLNDVVGEMGKLLPRLIGEDIELVLRTSPDLGNIRADAGQMEQVIMNLAVNSRDAMPRGGKLIIETANVELDHVYTAAHPVMGPGRYVLLAVTDTGCGMDAETQARIFEPFFTTKEKGKGTGLGLATVYGIVKQSGGFIWVYSEVEKGTTFKIYLPRLDEPSQRIEHARQATELPGGTETILLAEDEQDVRDVAREFLALAGYTVLEAKDGAEAVEIARRHAGDIHVLVTDMVMPGMDGRELATRLSGIRPALNVIYMSGYSEQAAGHAGEWDSSAILLTKPFTRSAILRAVREVLEGRKQA
jgi:two-component system cell cycle sensor histidine kinase/response regulator CckA